MTHTHTGAASLRPGGRLRAALGGGVLSLALAASGLVASPPVAHAETGYCGTFSEGYAKNSNGLGQCTSVAANSFYEFMLSPGTYGSMTGNWAKLGSESRHAARPTKTTIISITPSLRNY